MSEIRWTPEAAADLLAIHDYLARDDAPTAVGIAERIYESISNLSQFPLRGRPGGMADTRELTVSRLPYVVVYAVHHDRVIVLRVVSWCDEVAVACGLMPEVAHAGKHHG